MTSAEFVKKLRVYKARQGFVILGMLVVVSAIVPIGLVSCGQSVVSSKTFRIVVFCWVLLAEFVAQKIFKHLLRRQELTCPICHHSLDTIRIVETGKCPNCLVQVIRDV